MSRCQCNNPCTCYFEYDGDRPGTVYTQPYQYGRYNTRKSGSGTVADPYVIEFLDSEEFQVEAGQASNSGSLVFPSVTNANAVTGFNVIDYSTPYEIFLAFAIHTPDGSLYPSVHKFWFVSAHATFVSNASANGTRQLLVQWRPPADNYGPYDEIVLTGVTSTGLPGAEDITLNCSGLAPFASFTERKDFYGPGGTFTVRIQQNSGSNMTVNNIKFTLAAI